MMHFTLERVRGVHSPSSGGVNLVGVSSSVLASSGIDAKVGSLGLTGFKRKCPREGLEEGNGSMTRAACSLEVESDLPVQAGWTFRPTHCASVANRLSAATHPLAFWQVCPRCRFPWAPHAFKIADAALRQPGPF
jgi:hypothetical protein